jgi:hypothetical protein
MTRLGFNPTTICAQIQQARLWIKCILVYFSYFEKIKVGVWYHLALYIRVTPPHINFEFQKQSLWNLVCISWHLSPSQRRTSKIPPISLCVCICIPLIVARQRLGKYIPAAMNARNNRRNFGLVIFYVIRVMSKKSRRIMLLITSLFT